jgi:hypothetical protein
VSVTCQSTKIQSHLLELSEFFLPVSIEILWRKMFEDGPDWAGD